MTKQCFDLVASHITDLIANKVDTNIVFISSDIFYELTLTHEFPVREHRVNKNFGTEYFRFMSFWVIHQRELPDNTIWSPLDRKSV